MTMKNKFAFGAILGVAAGVIAGILTAPKSGKETRADIKDKASELKQNSFYKAKHVQDKVGEYKERGERTIEGVVEGAKDGFKTSR